MKFTNLVIHDYLSAQSAGKKFIIIMVVLFATSFLFYFSGINDYFIADSLVGLSLHWKDVWIEFISKGGVFGHRPLGLSWFVFNNSIWDNWAMGHRIFALALHAANGALLFLIAFRIKNNLSIAFVASLLFITFPVQVETVHWLAATAGSATSTFFFLLASWFWIKSQGFPRKKEQFLSALFFLFALLTKEISAALPLTLFMLDGYLKRNSPYKNLSDFIRLIISYWPFAISLFLYFSASYLSGAFNHSFTETSSGYHNFFALAQRFDQFFNVIMLPFSGFIEWRMGALTGLWITVFVLLLHLSNSARLFFTLALINLFPGIFYFADRLTYLPVAFWSLGLSIFFFNIFHFLFKSSNHQGLRLLINSVAIFGVILLLVLNYRFVNRKLEPWSNAAKLCRSIPEKVFQLLPEPEPGSQIILVDMTFSPGIPVTLWALFSETERRYNRADVEIRQIYDGPDVANLINLSSIPYISARKRYFIKYFQQSDNVEFVSVEEAGVKCPD